MATPQVSDCIPDNWDEVIEGACRTSLYHFVLQFWPVIESAPYIDNWHIKAVCDHLAAVTRGDIKRIIFNVPPGTSKSLLVSVFWPCWAWINNPKLRFFYASYDQRLSSRDSVKCRNLMRSAAYRRFWGDRFHIVRDQNQKTIFENDQGGWRMASSVCGHSTGTHPDVLVCDDPHSALQAASELERQRVIDWWDQAMSTRGISRSVAHVVVMQRLHHEDLSGHLLKRKNYVHFVLPMRYEKDRMEPTPLGWVDPRCVEGQLLTPKQFPEESVKGMEIALGVYGVAGQLQQRPAPKQGGLFKEHYFNQRRRSVPYNVRRIRYWDRACLIAGTMIDTSDGAKPIEQVVVGDLVLTRQGYKRVTWAGETKKITDITAVEFSNGSELRGTADHPVWTENRGWTTLADLCCSDYCINNTAGDHSWPIDADRNENLIPKSWNFRELLIDAVRESGISRRCGTIGTQRKVGAICCTERFGGITTAPFRSGMTFITKMMTGTTTTSPIWSACLDRFTIKHTECFTDGIKPRKPDNIGIERESSFGGMPHTESILALFAVNHSSREVARRLHRLFVLQRAEQRDVNHPRTNCARRVESDLLAGLRLPYVQSGATMLYGSATVFNVDAVSQRVVGNRFVAPKVVRRFTSPPTSVYDLTVEDAHEFFANGVLVHNSSLAETACYTAGVLLAQDTEGNYYVEDVVHGRWEPTERNAVMRATAIRDRSRYGPSHEPRIYVEAEGGSSGVDAWKSVARALDGFPVYQDRVTGKKDVRAEPWASQLSSNNVYLIDNGETENASSRAGWDIVGYITEHVLFKPDVGRSMLGRNKDRVDASTGAYNLFVNELRVQAPRIYSFKKDDPAKKLRLLVCTADELASLVEDNLRCLLVSVRDPFDKPSDPVHGVRRMVGVHMMTFADLEPKDHQATWDTPVPPYDLPISKLTLSPEAARDMWKFLLKRDRSYEAIIFQGGSDRRAYSLACGVADALGNSRKACIEVASAIDISVEGIAANQHVIDQVKTARGRLLM